MTKQPNQSTPTTPLRLILALIPPTLCITTIIISAISALIPAKYFWPIAIIGLIASFLSGYGIFRASKKHLFRTIFSSIIATLTIIINIVILLLANGVNSILDNLQIIPSNSERYSLIVLTENAEDFTLTDNTEIALLSSDLYSKDVENFITSEIKAISTPIAEATTLSLELSNQTFPSALINDAYLDLYQENYTDFYETITVITTYEIKITAKTIETNKKSVSEPFILYLSAIDTRNHDMPQSARSDLNILFIINPKTHKILTLNTPRDFYVNLATSGQKDKLTHAGLYGVEESIKTLENFYQISIDYYARVNFDALSTVVDAIGGVDIYSDYAFSAIHGGYPFKQGWNHLNGAEAVGFARERVSIAWTGGDRERGRNQQKLIEAIFKKISQPEVLVNASSILGALTNSLETNLGTSNIKRLINNQLDTFASWEIENIDVDGRADMQTTYTFGSGSKHFVWWPYEDQIETARARINEALKTN